MLATISESELENWVDNHQEKAPGLVADLIYWLIFASCPNPLKMRFPMSDSIWQHGPDGVLHVASGFEPFVAEGCSFWQYGSGRDAERKATDDYERLATDVPENKRRQSTFVFVTPRSALRVWRYTWNRDDQAAWIEERKSRNEWKDVRIIDATILVSWVSKFPAVGSWLASILLPNTRNNIQSLKQRWDDISTLTPSPSLKPDIFLVNQEEVCHELEQIFNSITTHLTLITRFPDQVINTVCGYAASLELDQRIRVYGRSLIVSDPNAWNTICEQFPGGGFVLIADPVLDMSGHLGSAAIQKARNSGHAVIFNAPPGGQNDPRGTVLKSPQGHQIEEALLNSGYPEQQARSLSYRCDRNLSFLLRLLRGHTAYSALIEISSQTPLHLALLVGSWTHNSGSDQNAIHEMTGIEYSDWIHFMREISAIPNPPIIDQSGDWKFITRYEGWFAIGNKLYDEHLDKFHQTAVSVLREQDPQYELPRSERMMAGIRGMVLSHSPRLRSGIAETLALLGSQPDALTSCSIGRAASIANRTIQDTLFKADWKLWASLDQLLPLLAEAAPSEFMGAVEDALNQEPCPFDQLFAQEGVFPNGSNHMSGLLWALETLAWEERFLFRSCDILGRLAERDPGGSWSNRPSGSLARILLPQLPGTTASVEKRIATVRLLTQNIPLVGWNLLLSLTQTRKTFVIPSRRPAWRNVIPDTWNENIRNPQYLPKCQEQLDAYDQMLVEMACNDLSKLEEQEFVFHLPSLPNKLFQRTIDHISSNEFRKIHEKKRVRIWAELSRLVRLFRPQNGQSRAVGRDRIKSLEAAIERIAPTEQSTINSILFSRDAQLLIDEVENSSESEGVHERLCRDAVAELLVSGSINEVLQLAEVVEYPNQVAWALAVHADKDIDSKVLPSLLNEEDDRWIRFTRGYLSRRLEAKGWEWVDHLIDKSWTDAEKSLLLSRLPFKEEAWIRAEKLLGSQEGLYWRKASALLHVGTPGRVGNAIEKLIIFGRARDAVRCIRTMLSQGMFYREHAILALMSIAQLEEPFDQDLRRDVIAIIQELQTDLEQNSEALWHIEWAYLGLLDGSSGATPVVLENRLASDPDFFCSFIKDILSPSETEAQPDQGIKLAAITLLWKWETPPGLQMDGTFSPDVFRRWLNRVKSVCSEPGVLEVALEEVGQVLVHCPADPKGLWIYREVAEELNIEEVEAMRLGFSRGVQNARGAHWVDPTGNPERELADTYRQRANEVEREGLWRLADTIRGIADRYDLEAKDVVDKAEKRP
ncbi:MAG: hypothetical protein OXH98_07275 [Caldilineaceae bacterium]|nr:hypothetical protein [Caldilineaceae bacterium]